MAPSLVFDHLLEANMPMFVDYDFSDTGAICRASCFEACRQAAVWPFVWKRDKDARPASPGIAEAYAAMYKVWRARIIRLSNVGGWDALPADLKDEPRSGKYKNPLIYRTVCMGNCPPVGYHLEDCEVHRCWRGRLCPMCYARQVILPLFTSMEWAFFLNRRGQALKDVSLVLFRRPYKPFAGSSRELLNVVLPRQIKKPMDVLERLKGLRIPCLGWMQLRTLEPCSDSEVILYRSVFAAVPSGAVAACDFPDETVEFAADKDKMTRADLISLVKRGAEYPASMMFGNPEMARNIYNAAAANRSPMVSSTGIFRNGATVDVWREIRRQRRSKEKQFGMENPVEGLDE